MLSPFLEMRIADLIDIALVATLVYAVLALIRRTQAAFVAIGILMVGALYVGARALDLHLMAWILQGFFAVFLIMVVVVFQEELRQLFERIALWSLRRHDRGSLETGPSDALVACLSEFAERRIGALVVLPGAQPIQRHIQGGIELGGKLSIPLLRSIFDPHSPGHDGAVIIEDDRVARFAAHLPLSKDFTQLANVGTRHSAALGLAERTDALCLVVSEERGQMSVAQRGRLQTLASPQAVGASIQQFLADRTPARAGYPVWRQLLRGQRAEKAIVLALVVALWYLFVPGSRLVELSFDVPVVVHNLPPDFEVESIDPPSVLVQFSGVRRSFYLFRPDKLEIVIDGSLAELGRRTFKVSAANLTFPKDLTLQGIEPESVKLSLRKISPPAHAPTRAKPRPAGPAGADL
jgi:diadenylate cyclase